MRNPPTPKFAALVIAIAGLLSPGCGSGDDAPAPDAGIVLEGDAGLGDSDGGSSTTDDGGSSTTDDASTRDGGAPMPPEPPLAPTAPTAPAAPAASSPPDLAVCPSGWRAVASSAGGPADPSTDYVTCEPYPGADPETCPLGLAHFVGTSGCQPVGDPCPAADEWPAGIDSLPSVIYVNDDATGVGLGNTRVGAYRTITQALARATAGTTVAVAKGTYDEVLTIPNGVTVLGACAAETRIRPTATYDRTAVTEGVVRSAAASTATLRNVSLIVPASTTLVGLSAYGDRNLVVRGVVVSGAYRAGLLVESGATLTAEGLAVLDTQPGSDQGDGFGVLVDQGTARITRAVILRSRDSGVAAFGGGVTLEDVAVIGTMVRLSDGTGGAGVLVRLAGQATIRRSLIDRSDTAGVAARDAGVVVTMTDSIVRRTETAESPVDGFGLFVGESATVSVERSTLVHNQSSGIIAAGAGADVTLSDVAVLDTIPLATGAYGRGLDVELGARVEATRALFDGNRDNGIFVSDPGTLLVATDVVVMRTEPGSASVDGIGALHVRSGAAASFTRVTLADNQEGGAQAVGSGTTVTLADLVLRDTDCGAALLGNGIDVGEGASVELARARLSRSQHVAIFASGTGSEVIATDLRINDSRPADSGERGWGIRAQDAASIRVERGILEDNHEIGVFARDDGTAVALVDVVVEDTASAADGTDGYGLLAFEGASLTVERGRVARSHDVAVLVSDTGTVATLTDLLVSETLPGPDGARGWGMAVQEGASVSATRAAVEGSMDLGVLVFDADLTLEDVLVRGVAERACRASGTCPADASWETGMGLVSLDRSTVDGTSVRVDSAARCGVLAGSSPGAGAGGVVLRFGASAVYRSAIGLCSQQTGLEAGPGLYLDATNGAPTQRTSFVPPPAVSFL